MNQTIIFLTILLATSQVDSNTKRNPNVVILVADDLGIGDLGCYGNTTIKTPNIDRISSEGVKLAHHLSAASFCTPSRAALLTARYPVRYGLQSTGGTAVVIPHIASHVALPLQELTLAKVLLNANYSTAAVGKWHLGSGCKIFGNQCNMPIDHGFQSFYGLPLTLGAELGNPAESFWIIDISDPVNQFVIASSIFFCVFFFASFVWIIVRCCHSKTDTKHKNIFGKKGKGVKLREGQPKKVKIGFCCIVSVSYTMMTIIFICLFVTWFYRNHYNFHKKAWWTTSSWIEQHFNSVLMQDDIVVERPLVLDGLEQRMAKYSLDFIDQQSTSDRPFFLYHGFGHTHTPMFTAPHMINHSVHGRYGDNIEEMDEVVGSILDAIDRNNIAENTIVYFVSDNGGHLEVISLVDGQREGGYNGLFKGGKGQGGSEGGIRVPGLMRWTGHLPAGKEVTLPTSTLDILPTMLQLAGLPPMSEMHPNLSFSPKRTPSEANRPSGEKPVGNSKNLQALDGVSVVGILKTNDKEALEGRVLLHYCADLIHAVRVLQGDHIYKLHLMKPNWYPNSTQCGWGQLSFCNCYPNGSSDLTEEPELYDISTDPFEDHPIPSHTTEYKEVKTFLYTYLQEWEQGVQFPTSMLLDKWQTIHSLWLQPF